MGQADLATRGQGAAGLAGLLFEEAAAFGGGQERLVDLTVVEGAGGDQVVEVRVDSHSWRLRWPTGAEATRASSWARAARA